jgi:hypothetical protein
MGNNPFGNLNALRKESADQPTQYTPKLAKKRSRERISGPFYQLSLSWADKAAAVSGRYHILAMRIYRCWRMRPRGATVVAVTTEELSGTGYSRDGTQRVVAILAKAGLIEIVEQRRGCAPRVRVIDPQLS